MKFGLLEFLFGIFIGVWVITLLPDNNFNLVHNAITACEKNLPRSQKCIITAIPEVKNKESEK